MLLFVCVGVLGGLWALHRLGQGDSLTASSEVYYFSA